MERERATAQRFVIRAIVMDLSPGSQSVAAYRLPSGSRLYGRDVLAGLCHAGCHRFGQRTAYGCIVGLPYEIAPLVGVGFKVVQVFLHGKRSGG